MTITRIYLVKHQDGAAIKEYLVDAGTQAAAERFISKQHVSASVASTKEVARMVSAGTKVLAAGPGSAEQGGA
jgi:hypothetical protein